MDGSVLRWHLDTGLGRSDLSAFVLKNMKTILLIKNKSGTFTQVSQVLI